MDFPCTCQSMFESVCMYTIGLYFLPYIYETFSTVKGSSKAHTRRWILLSMRRGIHAMFTRMELFHVAVQYATHCIVRCAKILCVQEKVCIIVKHCLSLWHTNMLAISYRYLSLPKTIGLLLRLLPNVIKSGICDSYPICVVCHFSEAP